LGILNDESTTVHEACEDHELFFSCGLGMSCPPCYTHACELTSWVIPALATQHAVFDNLVIWSFKMVNASQPKRPRYFGVPKCMMDHFLHPHCVHHLFGNSLIFESILQKAKISLSSAKLNYKTTHSIMKISENQI
jgi:hypothetical protein